MFNLKSILDNYVLSFDSNKSGNQPCVCCGKINHRYDRIDTIDLFEFEESFCILHWFQHVLDDKHICMLKLSQIDNI